jgi:hypothetical protein
MKQIKFLYLPFAIAAVGSLALLQSCKDDPKPIFAKPAIALSGNGSVFLKPSAPISVELNLTSEGGNGKLIVSKNGGFLEEVPLDKTATTFTYNTQTVDATSKEGDVITYSFILENTQELESDPIELKVNVAVYDEITIGTTKVYKVVAPNDNIIPSGTTVKFVTGRKYKIDSLIKFAAGSKLEVQAGVEIYFRAGGPRFAGIDVVLGLVDVQGTATSPVVMTSEKAINGGTPAAGDWWQFRIEGTGPGSNSGIVKYLRIENGGDRAFRLFNVGNGTSISFVQVLRSTTEGIMFTGGDVNVSNLICTDCNGGAFRMGEDYKGRMQFLIGVTVTRTATTAIPEPDDFVIRETAAPIIANVTLIGPGKVFTPNTHGIRYRTVSTGKIYNTVVTEYPRRGVRAVNNGTSELISVTDLTGPSVLAYSYVFNVTTDPYRELAVNFSGTFNATTGASLTNPFFNNTTNKLGSVWTLTAIPGIGVNDFIPNAETVSAFNPTTLGSFFVSAPYAGAIKDASATSDWTKGWTKNPDGTIR